MRAWRMDANSDPAVIAELDRAANGPLTVDITTFGRRSGAPRRIEIWLVKVGDRLVIGGTPGPRDWFANVCADPRLVVHLKDDVVADVPCTAREVTDPDTRREIWTHLITEWYRGQTPLDALVADAPTIELELSER